MNQEQLVAEKEALRIFQQARARYKLACKKRIADAARFKKISPDELTVGEYHAEIKSKEEHSKECKKRMNAEIDFNYTIRKIRNEKFLDMPDIPEGMKMKEAHELIQKAIKLMTETPSATDLARIDDLAQKLNPERKSVEEVPWMKAIADAARKNEQKQNEEDILQDGLTGALDPWDDPEILKPPEQKAEEAEESEEKEGEEK